MLEKRNINHAVSVFGYHIAWCPKYRKEVLKDYREIICKETIAQTCIEHGWSI